MKKFKIKRGFVEFLVYGLCLLAVGYVIGPDLKFLLKEDIESQTQGKGSSAGDVTYSFDQKTNTLYAQGYVGKNAIDDLVKAFERYPLATRLVMVDYAGLTFVRGSESKK